MHPLLGFLLVLKVTSSRASSTCAPAVVCTHCIREGHGGRFTGGLLRARTGKGSSVGQDMVC